MINKYDGRDGRLMIVITPCEPIAVCIDKNTTAAILEGRREDFRELYEVLKSEMERADPHDHSLEMRNTKMIEGRMTTETEKAEQEARKKLIEESMPDIYPEGN